MHTISKRRPYYCEELYRFFRKARAYIWVLFALSLSTRTIVSAQVMSSVVSFNFQDPVFNRGSHTEIMGSLIAYQYLDPVVETSLGTTVSQTISFRYNPVAFRDILLTKQIGSQTPTVSFTIGAENGKRYFIHFKKYLSDLFWQPLLELSGNGHVETIIQTLRLDFQSTFLRLQEQPGDSLNVKMPLPGGKDWYLTIEAGGKENCNGLGDDKHAPAAHYFALDFDDTSKDLGHEEDVPILASLEGTVVRAYCSDSFGWTVIIDHDAPYDEFPKSESGFTTLYAHMKSSPLVKQGEWVCQGTRLGFIGNTGNIVGSSHLHFELRYNGKSDSSIEQLEKVRIEKLFIEDYKVGCLKSRTGFYPSSNLETPNCYAPTN